jgi:hypothetical protein
MVAMATFVMFGCAAHLEAENWNACFNTPLVAFAAVARAQNTKETQPLTADATFPAALVPNATVSEKKDDTTDDDVVSTPEAILYSSLFTVS